MDVIHQWVLGKGIGSIGKDPYATNIYIYIQYRNVIYAIYIYICIIKYIQLQCTRTSFNILPAAPPFNKARYPKCILTSKLVLYIDLAGITYGMVAGNSSQSLVACDLG